MKKEHTHLPFLILVFLITVIIWKDYFNKQDLFQSSKVRSIEKEKNAIERIGERITYTVKMGSVRLGSAVYSHLPREILNSKSVTVVTFETRVTTFKDLERIYSDPETFLPLRVERSISTWPFPEKIVEEYDQKNFSLVIKKLKSGKPEERIIKKSGSINNAVLLPFFVRNLTELKIGWALKVVLPSQEFEIKLVSLEDVTVPAGTFKTYRFESVPPRFEIWVSADKRRIPVKIKGSSGIGYILLMREYKATT